MALGGQLKRLAGPAYLASSAADIFNASSSLIYTVIKQINLANVTGNNITATLYIGATGGSAGGTQIAAVSIPANSVYPLYFQSGLKLVSTDFLTGFASSGSSVTVTVMGEQVVV